MLGVGLDYLVSPLLLYNSKGGQSPTNGEFVKNKKTKQKQSKNNSRVQYMKRAKELVVITWKKAGKERVKVFKC